MIVKLGDLYSLGELYIEMSPLPGFSNFWEILEDMGIPEMSRNILNSSGSQ